MKKNVLSIAKAINDNTAHVLCKDGVEFDVRPIGSNVVILHHIEKEGRAAINNRVKIKLEDAEIFAKKHEGIIELSEEKYVSPNSDELRNPVEEPEEDFAENEDGFNDVQENEAANDNEWGDFEDDSVEETPAQEPASEESDYSFDDDDIFDDNEPKNVTPAPAPTNSYGWDDDDEPVKEEKEPDQLKTGEDNFTKGSSFKNISDEKESYIAQDMIVMGDVISKSSITVMGGVDGNVTAVKKAIVAGGVNGNVSAGQDILINSNNTDEPTEVRGDLTAQGNIFIDEGCVILGNIRGLNAIVKGSVLGEVDVKGKASICAGARIKGNITSKQIEIETGALVEGTCTQSYAEDTADKFFEQYASRLGEQQKDAEAVKLSITSRTEDVTLKELIG